MRLGNCVKHLAGIVKGAAFEVSIDELVAEGEGREAGDGHVEVDAAGISEGPLGGASTEEGSVVVERDRSAAWGSDKRRKGGRVKEWEWGSHRCLPVNVVSSLASLQCSASRLQERTNSPMLQPSHQNIFKIFKLLFIFVLKINK